MGAVASDVVGEARRWVCLRTMRLVGAFGLAACGAVHEPATREPDARNSPPTLASLDFIVGTWVADTEQGKVTERWARDGAALVGHSETVAEGRVAFHEELRIELRDGVAVYLASPMGRTPPIEFRRTDDGTQVDAVQFENPSHDFPKSIAYRRAGDRLTATIAGDGKQLQWEYARSDAALP